ncbi:helix-turn-helix domain-containing protein [Streptomyces sp. A5-4]|uniref:helix-turn-helix domain-containing protein n=1 Tax=Streptomyces sp. A5-4 TaxID=3384771 RepID=UPI003DA7D2D5
MRRGRARSSRRSSSAKPPVIDRQAINRIEQGHAPPRLDSLIRIAAALNVPVADFVRQ